MILPYIDSPATIGKEILQRNPYSLTICEKDKESRDEFEVSLFTPSLEVELLSNSNICVATLRHT